MEAVHVPDIGTYVSRNLNVELKELTRRSRDGKAWRHLPCLRLHRKHISLEIQ